MNLPNFVYYFKGKKNGPDAVIMGGIHGDETIGVKIIAQLKILLTKQSIIGEIYLIIGNPKAHQNNSRYVDCDLNRLFGDQTGFGYEQQRSQEIKPILKQADYLLDIHATSQPTVPFIFCKNNPPHLELATIFSTHYVVSTANNFNPTELTSSTDNFVDRHGGLGFTYETGWLQDNSTNPDILENVKKFLKTIGIAFTEESFKPTALKPKLLSIYAAIVPQNNKFNFIDNYKNFSFVLQDEPLATEGNKKIIAQHDSYIIFPKQKIQIGKPACYLAN